MSDDEDETQCPLCVEEMDLSDKNFLPCPCGYRVCMWCWHHIRENLNGLCPACRTPYNADPHAFSAVDRQEIIRKNRERKQKERLDKKIDKPASSSAVVSAKPVLSVVDRRHLHNYRVVQRNLVYVIGIPNSIANEELLKKPEYFGQYGKIGKVVIHRNLSSTHATASAYVTFVYKDDARASIQSLDGFWLDGHVLRASFGTTKYCNNFIRAVSCSNPECVYLHDLGDDDDRFTKEEIQAGHSKLAQVPGKDQTIVTGNGGPSGTGKRPVGESILPPPVFIQDINPSINSKIIPSKVSNWTLEGAQANGSTAPRQAEDEFKPTEDVYSVPDQRMETNLYVGESVSSSTLEPTMKPDNVFEDENHVSTINEQFGRRFHVFNGITTCAVFPVPVSSFSAQIWTIILGSCSDNLSSNPYDSAGIPFSELLDLTLPPVDATNLPHSSKLISIISPTLPSNSVNFSHIEGPFSSELTSNPSLKSSSILALRQIFPGVNMNVVLSNTNNSGGSNSSS